MQRLRHPIRAIREPFGKAGLTVAILALVMAMVGGAYAAGGLTKPQEKQVTKIAKKFAGKPGTNGTNGSNGAPGAKGDAGAKGDQGIQGIQGKQGIQGVPGTTGFAKELPSGESLEGEWSLTGAGTGKFQSMRTSVPFAFQLASAPTWHVIRVEEGEGEPKEKLPAGCTGNFEAPKAERGNLCVFEREQGNVLAVGIVNLVGENSGEGASRFGFTAEAPTLAAEKELIVANGSWAVTAP